jgi:hypothetical protein
MEPTDPNKKFEDLFKNFSFSFILPSSNTFNFFPQETAEQMIARLDEVDETVDAMTAYPIAERMLNELFNKEA